MFVDAYAEIESTSANRATVGNWAASVQPWMSSSQPGDDDDRMDDGDDGSSGDIIARAKGKCDISDSHPGMFVLIKHRSSWLSGRDIGGSGQDHSENRPA